MPITVVMEDSAELRAWGLGLEHARESCVFCAQPTRHWSLPCNLPVCQGCAQERTADDLAIAQAQMRLPRDATRPSRPGAV